MRTGEVALFGLAVFLDGLFKAVELHLSRLVVKGAYKEAFFQSKPTLIEKPNKIPFTHSLLFLPSKAKILLSQIKMFRAQRETLIQVKTKTK